MPCSDLHQFISLLESADELVRIDCPVDPVLEISSITDRVCKMPGGGKALFFSSPHGSTHAAATNLFGSERRVCMALGIESPDSLTLKTAELLRQLPRSPFDSLDAGISSLAGFTAFSPLIHGSGSFSDAVIPKPDVTSFPFLQSWPGDGGATGNGRYITLPVVITPGCNGTTNCGVYRIQIHGPGTLAVRWHPGSGGAAHFEGFRKAKKEMPLAIVLGGAPALLFSSLFPLPGDLDEITFAGFLRGKPLELVPCSTVPLNVPKDAELVIEGYVSPDETMPEGPFGNHTGRYAPAAEAPVIRITSLSHRDCAVIPSTVVGPPPMENCRMMKAWERILLAFLQYLYPEISDIWVPPEWTFHQSAIISLEKPDNRMINNLVTDLWKLPWFRRAKLLVFLDSAANPADVAAAAWELVNNPGWAATIIRDAAPGSERIALDATGWGNERIRLSQSDAAIDLVRRRWSEYGLDR